MINLVLEREFAMKKYRCKFIYYLGMLIMLITMYKLFSLSIFLYLVIGGVIVQIIQNKIDKK